MKSKLWIILLSLIVLTGCSKDPFNVELSKIEILVGSIQSGCEIVASVNGNKVDEVDVYSNTLLSNGLSVSCSQTDLNALGETLLVFTGNGQSQEHIVSIVDTIAPIIHMHDDAVIEVEMGNEFFSLKDLIRVSDNYDQDFYFGIDGAFNIEKTGTYKLKLVAKDSSQNTTEQNVTVVVKEKEKEIVTVVEEHTVYVQGAISPGESNPVTPAPTPSPSKGQRPNAQKFLFTDGYNMNTAYESCASQAHNAQARGWGASCTSIDDSNGYSLGMQLTIFD